MMLLYDDFNARTGNMVADLISDDDVKHLPVAKNYLQDSHSVIMDSVFAKQSRGCGLDTQLVHNPVMLGTNVHPGVMKANRPFGVTCFRQHIK